MTAPLVQVEDLQVLFPMREGLMLPGRAVKMVHAVDGVSFDIHKGEILAMVGESGCGKTTLARALLRLVKPTGGKIVFGERDITALKGAPLRNLRRRMQMIFQDPYESLDPRQSIFELLAEPLKIHHPGIPAGEMETRVFGALESAGLHPAQAISTRYPHHLSGGQRQRVAIAAAMILEPEFVVTDEPVSMLDVSIRAEILKLMLDLRDLKNLTYLFITHDLSLAWMISDRIVVLYLGKIVEIGLAQEVIHHALHPYTRALVSVIPLPQPGIEREQIILEGETPSPLDIPKGCRFLPRCWKYRQLNCPSICKETEPLLQANGYETHKVACHFADGG
jgi:peptide/nickel transport system ATP-binding protein